jgi:hypothetical protein
VGLPAIGGRVNVETVDAKNAYIDPAPLPGPLQGLSLKDGLRQSFACVVWIVAWALGFVAGQTMRGFTPPKAGPPRLRGRVRPFLAHRHVF